MAPLKKHLQFTFNKLARDRIPEVLEAKGVISNVTDLSASELLEALKHKVIEEAREVAASSSVEELKEELADLMQVIHSLAEQSDLSLDTIEARRCSKLVERGGFSEGIHLSSVDIPEGSPEIKRFVDSSCCVPQCIFCEMALGTREVDVVARYSTCFVIRDQYPVSKGHMLIIPYAHTESWLTAPSHIRHDIIDILEELKTCVDRECAPNGYNIGMNCGAVAGQTVMHLHVHLIPRYSGDMHDPKGGVRGVIPEKQKY